MLTRLGKYLKYRMLLHLINERRENFAAYCGKLQVKVMTDSRQFKPNPKSVFAD